MGRHVAHRGKIRMYTKFQQENPRGRDHFEDLHVDGKVILEWILGIWGGRYELDIFGSE
jgi:hypothetical protein